MTSARLFISNVSDKADNDDIKELFNEYGKVVFCDIKDGQGYLVSQI